MSRELLVVWVGRHRRQTWDRLCEPYKKRIARHVALRERPLRPRVPGDEPGRLKAEGEALLAAVPEKAWTVVLDRRGRMRSSTELARWLQERLDTWPYPLAFLIGSDLGVADFVLAAVRERLSLGPLTLPHELVRLVLYEQIYRSVAIAAGIKYHRQPL